MAEDTNTFLQGGGDCGAIPDCTPATDKAWAVAFKINAAVTVVSALYFGSAGFQALRDEQSFAGSKLPRFPGDGGSGGMLALFVVGGVCLGWLFAWGLLNMIIRCSKEILHVVFCSGAAIFGLVAVHGLPTGYWLGWIVYAALCAWSVRFFLKRRRRLTFGSASLKVAALAIKSMRGFSRVALLLSGVQVAWILLAAVAAVGSMASLRVITAPDGTVHSASACREVSSGDSGSSDTMSCECGGEDSILMNSPCVSEAGRGSFWLGCFWLASIAWASAVLRNVVTATVAGSVASWWFSPGDKSSVRGALYRATHESFGSLCRASNLVAVVRPLITALRRITKLGRRGGFLLEWLRDAVSEALDYVICLVSIYGLSFPEAGQRVKELFRRRGVTTIANDVVVETGLVGVVLGATMLYWVVAILLLALVSDTIHGDALPGDVVFDAFRLAFYIYYPAAIAAMTMLTALKSGAMAVFVCFAQDPEALLANHDRQIYEDLSKAWREMQAESPSTTSEPEDVGIHHA